MLILCNYHHVNIVTFDPFQLLSLYIAILSHPILVIREPRKTGKLYVTALTIEKKICYQLLTTIPHPNDINFDRHLRSIDRLGINLL